MNPRSSRSFAFAVGAVGALLCGGPAAVADDTELFVSRAGTAAAAPNVLFIFDTSGSMETRVESQAGYDAGTLYAGACRAGSIYWRSGSGDPPACSTDRWFEESALRCRAAREAFDSGAGRLTDHVARFDPADARWKNLLPAAKDHLVECEDDRGRDGSGTNAERTYAREGDPADPWSDKPEDEINWPARETHTLYAANFLNWYYGPTTPTTRIDVIKEVAKSLVGSINGVNVGVMRYNADQGGRLVHEVGDVTEHRDALLASIDALTASGMSPMAETFFEAALYFRGLPPHYGGDGAGVYDGAYRTPVEQACQKHYIVYLGDGEPSADTDVPALVSQLPAFTAVAGSCAGGDGACLENLARYLYEADLDPNLPGQQNVVTYTVGFASDAPLLSALASRGGGRYYTAGDTASLSQTLTNIVTSILETQATFTAPAVTVNSFNRARHLNDLFITVFQPRHTLHWPGNLKKYRLRAEDARIVDVYGRPAVDESGFFAPDSQSWWSDVPDGHDVTQGGAANRLPSPDSRRVYTYLGGAELTSAANAVHRENALLTSETLYLGDPGDPSREEIIDFIRGRDVADSNGNGSTADARRAVGDPLHSQPVTVIYGGTPGTSDIDDAVVFFATNDGLLHAIDPTTGAEKWAFVAPEFLADQSALLENPPSASKHYGIDGSLRVQIVADADGTIDRAAGEKVHLFFGLRRGGSVYYALDVTDPDSPRVMWRLDDAHLPGLGQTWSSPVPTRVRIEGAHQNDADTVVVFAGGYDETQDRYVASSDAVGNAVYIVDSVSGALLWHGARSGGTRDFADMRYSIPADVKVIDLDGDGYADRVYAADMGGQIWRFDVYNGKPASSLVAGGVIARLGSAASTQPTAAETRRFYYAPDVALATSRGSRFLHIGIGSGYRAHPNATENHDRFYALRDHDPFTHLTQTQFEARRALTESDLTDVTADLDAILEPGANGWMLRLEPSEKVLAEARTFANDVYFTTFTPAPPSPAGCEPALGTNRLYVVSLFNGAPVNNLDGAVSDENPLQRSRFRVVPGSVPSEVVFLFPSPDDPASCRGDECSPPPIVCVDLLCYPTGFVNHPIRTFWRQENVD
jgi:type IV pilus assembly protein PilY1